MLETAISITEFIVENQGRMITALVVLCFVLASIIALYEYKDKLWERIVNPRNKWYFVMLIVLTALLLGLASSCSVPFLLLIVDVILWVLFFIACFCSLPVVCGGNNQRSDIIRKFRSRKLFYLHKHLDEGLALEYLDYFKSSNIYDTPSVKTPFSIRFLHMVVDSDVKLSYQFLKSSFLFHTGDVVNAYSTLSSIDRRLLYPEELQNLDLDRAVFLTLMGDINAAKQLLGNPDDNASSDPEVWMSYAYIAEDQGDMDAAYQFALKSKSLAEVGKYPDWQLAQIFNNYSRFALMIGNRTETLQYLDRAWEKTKDCHSVDLIHVIGSNRVLRKAIEGCSKSDCYAALKEYKNRVRSHSVNNSIEIENCEIQLGRQFSNDTEVYNLIKDGYKNLINKLDVHQRELFKASTFRMLMNGLYVHDWLDSEISLDINTYKQLTLEERLRVFKEYIDILTQKGFASLRNQEPYKSLYSLIVKYYKDSAVKEIDGELARTESYCVYRQNELMKLKLGILRIVEGSEHLEKSKKLYLDQYEMLDKAGLKIEATYALLLLMDECTTSYNVKIQTTKLVPLPGSQGLMLVCVPAWRGYYSDFIESMINSAPSPTVLDDRIHVNYPQIGFSTPVNITPTHDDIIKEYIDVAIQDFDSLKNHPSKIDMSIEIAHLCMAIGGHDEIAKRMLQYFKKANVNPRQFATWFRYDVEALEKDLAQKQSESSMTKQDNQK